MRLAERKAVPARRATIHGEICDQDERGVTDFSALPAAIKSKPQDLVFFAFDLLHLDGEDLRAAPHEERRAKLRLLISQVPSSRIVMGDEYDGDGQAFFDLVSSHDLEGMVSKRKGSRYWSGPSEAWYKTKCWTTSAMQVIGGERDKSGVPYALLANKRGYQGTAFVGLPARLKRHFWSYFEGKAAARTPIIGLKRDATSLQPGMTAKVRYLKGSDKMRHAVVQGVSLDAAE